MISNTPGKNIEKRVAKFRNEGLYDIVVDDE
jgi:hypothetical protein